MGRKTQVTKEQILEAGLKIIIREGYEAVSIKTVAAELNMSTTPIAWTFGNIETYRQELAAYAENYLKEHMLENGKNHYRRTVEAYVDMTLQVPNLILYLRSNRNTMESLMMNHFVFDDKANTVFREKWADELQVTEEQAIAYIKFLAVYTEGVVSLILTDGIHVSKDIAYRMLDEAESAYMTFLKANN